MSYFEECMYFSANLLARRLNSIADQAFKDMEITTTQGFTLLAIDKLGLHTPSEIAIELEMNPSTITRFLDKLETLGYVERTYCGRHSEVNITPLGLEQKKAFYTSWNKVHQAISDEFGEEDARAATKLIVKMNHHFDEKQ